ncbi:spore gernimation protein GerPB [Bacillus sp. FJAT-42376]|uniref:spore germination protein GerPB n=1 Tax=Bacillus sp. FJAT-42376 TaxID=2014076 RepID=UPI000F5144D0|nr:spore germination protein GerPB [Bacillus sp. FJAT-42376]AZB42284.1 spore gernimation protein GerPB [Bacillus sp. FJAT-42376]
MNFYINQSICINYLRVGAVNNSSVLQIGSAGYIKSLSNLYNTGGFFEAAPPATRRAELSQALSRPVVPLAPPPSR